MYREFIYIIKELAIRKIISRKAFFCTGLFFGYRQNFFLEKFPMLCVPLIAIKLSC
jgi:hypothetical protein